MKHLLNSATLKFFLFAAVMLLLTGFIFLVLSNSRTGATKSYSAIFNDVSDLESGDTVRVAGVRVGTVSGVELRPDNLVTVAFDAASTVPLTSGTRAAVRYLNLVGDRYLELVDSPGSTRILPPNSVIPVDRTSPALDLDLLLGGLKPVVQGLNARDVNALTSSLLQIMQGQEGAIESLLSKTSSFSNTLADNGQVVEQVIDNLKELLATLDAEGDNFSATIDRLEQLVSGLAKDRDPIGEAIEALNQGTASVAGLLGAARPPLAGTVDQLSRLSSHLTRDLELLDYSLQKAPDNYRKTGRSGSYGGWTQFYICDLAVRINDSSGRVMSLPWIQQNYGRCEV